MIIWNLKETVYGLKCIASSPAIECGGFQEQTIKVAKSALYHIKRLQKKDRKVQS